MEPQKQPILLYIVFIIIGIAIGFMGGYYMRLPQNQIVLPQINIGNEEKKIVQEVFGDIQVNSLAGKVLEVMPSGIIIEVASVYSVPLPKTYQRKEIAVNATTAITLQEDKDIKTFEEELKKARAAKGVFTPPLPYKETQIIISNIPVGEMVNIAMEQPVNILNQKFDALKIIVKK